jgi:dihydroorotate dehydrogenase (fumarate)
MNTQVKLFGKTFDNPLLPASGPIVGELETLEYFNESLTGGIVTKTISVGGALVKKPCIIATKHCVHNTELWSEYPLDKWSVDILPGLAKNLKKPLIVSVGYTAEDLEIVVPQVEEYADFFEVSTHYGKDKLESLVTSICQLTDKPVFIKLSPHIEDYLDFVEIAVNCGASGIVAINSLGPGVVVDLAKRAVKLGIDGGKSWVSGPSIKPVALNRVANIRKRFPNLSIIACGGVESAEDVLEFILAGADLVQMLSSALMKGRELFDKIVKDLPGAMQKYDIKSIEDLRNTDLLLEPQGRGGYPIVDNDKCTRCGLCTRLCPQMALTLEDEIMLDKEKCINCGLCQSKCPVEAIKGVL